MWNAKESDTGAVSCSANRKNIDLEECKCASEQMDAVHNSKQQLNSKDEPLSSKVAGITDEETVDSGFISGLNTSSSLAADEENIKKVPDTKLKKQPAAATKEQKNLQETSTFLDSGCIEPEENFIDEVDEFDESIVGAAAAIIKQVDGTSCGGDVAKTADVGGVTATAAAAVNKTKSTNNNMRFKNNVDNGISERFCALSLQTGGAEGINNLNASTRSAPIETTGARAQPQKRVINNKVRQSDWEEFYHQNSDGDTPLHLACLAGAEDVVIALLRIAIHPCLYNIQNDDAQTPLHMAALSAQPKILRILAVMGAEPSIRDRHGNTALHLAVNSGDEQCVRALLTPISPMEVQEALRICAQRYTDKKLLPNAHTPQLPQDLEIRNYNGERCVHLAAQEGRINILRMLVACGADINAREGKSGLTPLHFAIESCNETLVKFLLEECQSKLDLETVTYAGLTAYQFACMLDREQLQSALEKCGAEPLTPPESDYELSDSEDLDDSKVSLTV